MRALIVLFETSLSIFLLNSAADCTDNSGRLTISSPGWKTANTGEYCKLQWVVISGSFSNYTISKIGSATIDSNTYQAYDISQGVITLHFWNIQTSNGGSYTLTVTPDPLKQTFVGNLFVYASPYAYITQTVGSSSPSLGDTVEMSCSAYSYSQPAERRPPFYYFWYHSAYGDFQNISSGPVTLINGDPLPGYSIKNDSRTLVIASVQARDARQITCSAREYGSPYSSWNYHWFSLNITYRPYVTQTSSGTNKINVDLSSSISINWNFNYAANPAITLYSNWTLVNRTGYTRVFQLDNSSLLSGYVRLTITLPNREYYGNYSVTIGNTIGSTTVTVQVLERGAPDMPTNLAVLYTTHNVICLKWKCQPGNSGSDQTVLLRLRDVADNTEIETRKIIVSDGCINTIYQTVFRNAIQQETLYEATIWSTNSLGSSRVSKINFKTQPRVFLTVAPETISISVRSVIQSDALIIVTSTYPDVAWLNVTCCVEETNECFVRSYNVFFSLNQIIFDNLPHVQEYVFDFTLFNGDFFNNVYILAMFKGVRVPKSPGNTAKCNTPNEQSNDTVIDQMKTCFSTTVSETRICDKENSYLVAVIVLAVLLGVAVLGLIGCLVACLVSKIRSSIRIQPRNLEQRATAVRSVYPPKQETEMDAKQEAETDANPYSNYESMYADGELGQN